MTINQSDRIESYDFIGMSNVLDYYYRFSYNSSFSHFDVVTVYDNTNTQVATTQFLGWNGKRNPYFGRVGELIFGLGHHVEFDYWMAQNPTSYVTPMVGGAVTTSTITYNSYNADDFPTDFDIVTGGNSTNYTYTYSCY